MILDQDRLVNVSVFVSVSIGLCGNGGWGGEKMGGMVGWEKAGTQFYICLYFSLYYEWDL